jgi:hypothetical protein
MSYTQSERVVLNFKIKSFLADLAKIVEAPLHVTSGVRTAKAQVDAVCTKVSMGDNLSIYNAEYRNLFLNNCPETKDLIKYQKKLFKEGRGSRHGHGQAVDLRNRNLTQEQQNEIIFAARSLGATTLVEPTPPHIHIELDNYNPFTPQRTALIASGVLGLAGISYLLWKKFS